MKRKGEEKKIKTKGFYKTTTPLRAKKTKKKNYDSEKLVFGDKLWGGD